MTTARTTPSAPVGASRGLSWLILLSGLIGLAASAQLTLDKIRLIENPAYQPNCNINPIISCGSIMRTDQAEAFGFPNPIIGLAAFGALAAIGAGLLAGASYRRWLWLSLQGGALLGLGFVAWLIDQALYEIGALCPYCMVVWAVVITLFWSTTVHNLRTGVLPAPASVRRLAALPHQWLVPVAGFLVIALLILTRFWYYWSTLL
ncbi:vitamin K epoxide reductase family protein [Kitasatospora cheerisanensis]|uniref:Vitamin K epoxide reductase n=1 Tax=Kitasatospora cheerisanensis KCTC 2395 TaxID=1348663 RepID=A0A066ZA66_9ACTN|nr:vitamin K epoxide reductase family protein [Kitasatospora cheerisanensis]KDN87060.1 vitamin K epoxide reductase [Kitasatospora cheerisanensis KCTC 2395]